jgi:hypothetical protein
VTRQRSQNLKLTSTERSVIHASVVSEEASARGDRRTPAVAAGDESRSTSTKALGSLLRNCYELKLLEHPPLTRVRESIN